MLATLRAELLVLRKSRVAWALLLIMPMLTLVTTYGFSFADYLGLTPATYAQFGTPAQNLQGLLPIQFDIQAVNQLSFAAPFIVLGAVIAGGDWGRGTIKTSLLQGPSRARTFAGQTLAIMAACASSVVLSFALAAISSALIRWYVGSALAGAGAAFPAASVVGRAVAAGLLVGVAYGALGIALGTLCRSAGGGVAAALLWYALVDGFLYDLSINAGGPFQAVYNAFPEASVITLTSMFGSPGGGASSATYQPVRPLMAILILLGYTAAFCGLAFLRLRRSDVASASGTRFARRRPRESRPRESRPRAGRAPADSGDGRRAGVLASWRAELLVMSRWPAMWAFVLALPVFTLLNSYIEQYVLYLRAGVGAIVLATPSQVLPGLLPGKFVAAVLNSIGYDPTLAGTAAFFLIGALASGSNWAGGTIKTSLLQGPTRVRTCVGQALAVAVALTVSVAATFAVSGLFSLVVALTQARSVTLEVVPHPPPTVGGAVAGFGIAVVVSLAWGAVGWTAGTLLKSAAGAFAVIMLWTTIVQLQLDQAATEVSGPLRVIYDLLPDASTDTVTNLFGAANQGYAPSFAEVAPLAAFAILALYALGCFVLPVVMTRRRDLL
jgi:ABC-type transport system involved in multi-copper enzyme maturation permease subunit